MNNTERNTLAALETLAGQGVDSLPVRELARHAGHNQSAVNYALQNLRAAGFISWHFPDAHTRRFTIHTPRRPGSLSNPAALTFAALRRIQAARVQAARAALAKAEAGQDLRATVPEILANMPPTGPRVKSGVRAALRELEAGTLLERRDHSRAGFRFSFTKNPRLSARTLATLADPPSSEQHEDEGGPILPSCSAPGRSPSLPPSPPSPSR